MTETDQSSCGLNQILKYDLDQIYRYKYLKEFTRSSPADLTRTVTESRTYQDNNGDGIPDLITRVLNINGWSWTSSNNTLVGSLTSTSPMGRTINRTYDPINLLTRNSSIPGILPISFGYDVKGRRVSATQGVRISSISYSAQGNIESLTTPDGKTLRYTYDSLGRLKTQILPDTTVIAYDYDPNGNMTVLTNPRNISHGFDYNRVNRRKTMTMPLSGSYQYIYDKERNLKSIHFPSGKQIENTYAGGLLRTASTPEGTTNYTYNCSSLPGGATKGTEKVTYGYDGSLLTSDTRTGLINQTIGYSYNIDFRLASMSYSGISQPFAYDLDGLLTGAGPFTITRNAQNGLPERLSDGTFTATRTFNGYGELDDVTYAVGGAGNYGYTLTRDLAGRITQKVETIAGVSDTFDYRYDNNGRLFEVKKNGSMVEAYTYDGNGNRTLESNSYKGITNRPFTYSNEDHVITAGPDTYQFDLDGFLIRKTTSSGTTTTSYSSRGELLSVALPGGTTITYDHDPMGRRIARRDNGIVTEKYLWANAITLLAVYDGSDNLLMRFTYADGRMPVAMTYNGSTYYLLYDQIGTLKAVTDSSGTIVKKIDYDSFGSIISDTNPGMNIPFGFAGGLHDRDTGLVRFGARDYDPALSRWTAKDPIVFAGRDTNLYGYVLNNPITRVDPRGLFNSEGHGGSEGTAYIDEDEDSGLYHFGVDPNEAIRKMTEAACAGDEKEYDRNLHAWEDSWNPAHENVWAHLKGWVDFVLSGRKDKMNPDSIRGPYEEQYNEMNRQRPKVLDIWNRRNKKQKKY